ncbi:hypothetical protein BH18THE2_BH18THE2_33440 [soil metagenome]
MMTMAARRKDDNRKLTKVLSTKLSTEDYNVFRVLTNIVYHYKLINQDNPSEMLQFIVTPALDGLRKQSEFSRFYDCLGKTRPAARERR